MDAVTKQTVREISAEIDKRLTDKIIEKSNAELLKKLLAKAESPTEAFAIAALGTTYKRTGFHFDKRLERVTDSVRYLKKNEALSFTQEEKALTHTLVIGDNYPALLNLLVQYQGKIDVIYIDPPYGKDDMGDFAKTNYNNDITRDNLLSMLYPRLQLAKRLLSDTGVIFCSIDDRNQAYVKGLFDEVFGEGNFVAQITVVVKPEGRQYGYFAKTHEYVLVYCKSEGDLGLQEVEMANGEFKYQDDKGGFNTIGLRNRAVRIFNSSNRPNLRYPFYVDETHKDKYGFSCVSTIAQDGWTKVLPSIVDGLESVWRWGKETAEQNKTELVALKGSDGEIRIFKKDRDLTTLPKTVWFEKEFNSITGTRETAEILSKGAFDYPKPVALIKYILKTVTNEDALVLDFFAGSGTTGQAVLELNQEDGGRRKFILCTNNEVSEDEEIDFFTKKGLLPPMPTEKAEKEKWDTLHKILKDTKEYKKLAETEELKTLGIAYNVTSKRLKRVMTGSCYDGTNNFKWLEKHSPLGDNLLVLDVAEEDDAAKVNSLQEGERLPDKIDETLYGKKKMPLAEKIQWLMNNFENVRRAIE